MITCTLSLEAGLNRVSYGYKALNILKITITDCDYIIAKLTPGTQSNYFTVVAN